MYVLISNYMPNYDVGRVIDCYRENNFIFQIDVNLYNICILCILCHTGKNMIAL